MKNNKLDDNIFYLLYQNQITTLDTKLDAINDEIDKTKKKIINKFIPLILFGILTAISLIFNESMDNNLIAKNLNIPLKTAGEIFDISLCTVFAVTGELGISIHNTKKTRRLKYLESEKKEIEDKLLYYHEQIKKLEINKIYSFNDETFYYEKENAFEETNEKRNINEPLGYSKSLILTNKK